MDNIIRKIFFHYEKEEKWLNEMAAKGYALVNYTYCKYVFTPCRPGEFTYRIELLPELPEHPESLAYIDFVKEAGAEHIASFSRWIYLRRKAEEGPFEIYSDADARIKHYKLIMNLWGIIGMANLFLWAFVFFGAFAQYKEYGNFFLVIHNLNLM